VTVKSEMNDSPKSEVRSPKSEVRSPKSEVRSPKSEVRMPKSVGGESRGNDRNWVWLEAVGQSAFRSHPDAQTDNQRSRQRPLVKLDLGRGVPGTVLSGIARATVPLRVRFPENQISRKRPFARRPRRFRTGLEAGVTALG